MNHFLYVADQAAVLKHIQMEENCSAALQPVSNVQQSRLVVDAVCHY